MLYISSVSYGSDEMNTRVYLFLAIGLVALAGLSHAASPLQIINISPGPETNYYFFNTNLNVSANVIGGSGNYLYNWTVYSGSCPNGLPANLISSRSEDTWSYKATELTSNCILKATVSDPSNSLDKSQSKLTGIIDVMYGLRIQWISPLAATTINTTGNVPVNFYVTVGTGNYSYSWSLAQGTSCPGFVNPGSVNSIVYKPNATTSNCTFQIAISMLANNGGTVFEETHYSAPIKVVNVSSTSTITTSTTTSTTSVPSTTTITAIGLLPRDTLPSGVSGNTKVEVGGEGFTPGAHVNFGYASDFPPNTNAIAATYANSNGSWIMNFSAPWELGDYKMIAIDSKGVSATATLIVSGPTPFITFSFNGKPSNSLGNNKVLVSGYNFTPNTLVNLGYFANFPPYTNAIFATTTDSTGSWTGSFSAPWNTGSYRMLAIDSHGINATNILYVGVPSTTTTTIPTTTTTIPASSCSGTPNLIIGPNPAPASDAVFAGVTGLSGCNGYTITINDYQGCISGSTIASFTSNSTGGGVSLEDPSANGQYGYYACVNGQSSSEYVLTVAPFTGTTSTIASTTTIP